MSWTGKCALFMWILAALAGQARADPEAVEAILPVFLDGLPAAWPDGAEGAGLEGQVTLSLVVSETGEVVEVAVAEGAGHGFDEAAVQAAWSYRFTPARDDAGQPSAARIGFVVQFRLDAVPDVALEGQVLRGGAGGGTAVRGASLELSGPDEVRVQVRVDENGGFRVAGLKPGTWTVLAQAPGHQSQTETVEVAPGTALSLTVRLRPENADPLVDEVSETILVVDTRLRPEVSERRLSAATVEIMPGAGGDLVRALQNLPGVARTPFGAGQLLVRGTAPEDSAFFVDGLPLPLVYHFGGFSTVVDPALLDEVVFLPGGYGARYGEGLGGMVDLRLRRDPPEEREVLASLDLFQARSRAAVPLGEQGALAVGMRQSHLHLILNPIVNLDPSYSLRIPRYSDAHLRLWRRGDRGGSDALLLASEDRFSLRVANPDGEDGWARSDAVSRFLKARLGTWRDLGGGWQLEASVMGGPEHTGATYDDDVGEASEHSQRADLRIELNRPVLPEGWVGWRMGVEAGVGADRFVYDMSELSGLFPDEAEAGDATWSRVAVYLEQTQRGGRFTAVPGVRVQGRRLDGGDPDTAVDPRIAGSWALDEATELRASVGQVSQYPEVRELVGEFGESGLSSERALQTTLSLQRALGPVWQAELGLYHSRLGDLVVGHEDRVVFALSPPPEPPLDLGDYANQGTGRAFGAELLLRLDAARTEGWLALTWSRSLRRERPGEDEVPFSYDQPLVAQLVGTHALGGGWRVGGRARVSSGNPHTPITNRLTDLEELDWYPIYDIDNSGRLQPWYSLDLRVDRSWSLRRSTLRTYLELLNSTNRRNVELVTWSADYAEQLPIYGLPLLPVFGLELQW